MRTDDRRRRRQAALRHGTRADLKPGDLLGPGFDSNCGKRRLSWIYFLGHPAKYYVVGCPCAALLAGDLLQTIPAITDVEYGP